MRVVEAIRAEEVSRASAEAEAHARAAALAAFADDVLFRQAEGRTLWGGSDFVRLRADAHGVLPEDADTALGNLVEVFERGPRDPGEHAVAAAFAVRGFAARLRRAAPEERREIVERFVAHADWLEVATPYRVHAFVRARLYAQGRELLRDVLLDGVLADAASPVAGDPGVRARTIVRLPALAELPEGRAALARVARAAEDATVRALAASLESGTPLLPREGEGLTIAGRLGRAPGRPAREVLRLLTGLALLEWVGRLLGALLGVRREASVTLHPTGLRVARTTTMFGRAVRADELVVPLAGVVGAERHARWPSLHLLVGAVALALGIVLGGVWTADAVRTGETYLFFAAAAALLLGAGLDLALDVVVPARRARVAFELRIAPGRSLRLRGVDADDADRFLHALELGLRGAAARGRGA